MDWCNWNLLIVTDDDWGGPTDDQDYLPERESSNLTLPRITRSPERGPVPRGVSPASHRNRKQPELRQRSPSPQYQPRVNPGEVTSPRERFQDAKEMFRAMEREAFQRPVITRQREPESHAMHRLVMLFNIFHLLVQNLNNFIHVSISIITEGWQYRTR